MNSLIALGLLIALVRVWVVIGDLRLRRKVFQRGSIGRIEVASALLLASSGSSAALPAELPSAIVDYGVDVVLAIGLAVVAGFSVWLVKRIKRDLDSVMR
ncbi:hypothetical protein [Variovorax sp. tm]|uniref:hypothetical protein n=1 Tax=Variovorax atrisoli TaxID=3394203 RepID=UPI003A7FFBBD